MFYYLDNNNYARRDLLSHINPKFIQLLESLAVSQCQFNSIIINHSHISPYSISSAIINMHTQRPLNLVKTFVLFDSKYFWGSKCHSLTLDFSNKIQTTALTSESIKMGRFSSQIYQASDIVIANIELLYNHYQKGTFHKKEKKEEYLKQFGLQYCDSLIIINAFKNIGNKKLNNILQNFDLDLFLEGNGKLILISLSENQNKNDFIHQMIESQYQPKFIQSARFNV